jgi:hypothetical protein
LRSPSPDGDHAAGGQQGVADDDPGAELLGLVAADAAVVVREPVEVEVPGQAVQAGGDPGRPRELVVGDGAGDRIARGVGEGERLADLGLLGGDLIARHLSDAGREVVDLEHLDVRAGLRVHRGEVRVEVEHPRIGVPEEADARPAQRARGAGRAHPGGDPRPRPLVVVDRAGHGVVRDAGPRAGAGDLRDAARRAVGQPLARVRVRVVQGRRRLQPEQHDGHPRGLEGGEDLARGRVGHRVAEHEVDLRGGEAVPRLARLGGRVHQSRADHVGPQLAHPRLDALLIALDAVAEPVELVPVGLEPDPEDPDPRARRGPGPGDDRADRRVGHP